MTNAIVTEEERNRIAVLIHKTYDTNIRKSVGKMLQLPESDINTILEEYEKYSDGRFEDSHIYACGIVKRLREDWNYSAMFRDR